MMKNTECSGALARASVLCCCSCYLHHYCCLLLIAFFFFFPPIVGEAAHASNVSSESTSNRMLMDLDNTNTINNPNLSESERVELGEWRRTSDRVTKELADFDLPQQMHSRGINMRSASVFSCAFSSFHSFLYLIFVFFFMSFAFLCVAAACSGIHGLFVCFDPCVWLFRFLGQISKHIPKSCRHARLVRVLPVSFGEGDGKEVVRGSLVSCQRGPLTLFLPVYSLRTLLCLVNFSCVRC